MYVRTFFWGVKTCKIGEKSMLLVMFHQFWKGHDGKIKKKHAKMRI